LKDLLKYLEGTTDNEKYQEILERHYKPAPIGRPKGSKNRETLLREFIMKGFEESMVENFPDLMIKTVELAKKGDSTCMKILWDRLIPSKKAIDALNMRTANTGINIIISTSDPIQPKVSVGEVVDGETEEMH
tara:strand:+ start:389 stop:787 length:399 start_codon:yes stop_codon:yes gene_type:complete